MYNTETNLSADRSMICTSPQEVTTPIVTTTGATTTITERNTETNELNPQEEQLLSEHNVLEVSNTSDASAKKDKNETNLRVKESISIPSISSLSISRLIPTIMSSDIMRNIDETIHSGKRVENEIEQESGSNPVGSREGSDVGPEAEQEPVPETGPEVDVESPIEQPALVSEIIPTTEPTAELTAEPSTETVGYAVWQDDNTVKACPICRRTFNFFNRRHHCRRCGKIFCNDCCGKFCTFIPDSYVVEPQEEGGGRIVRGVYRFYRFRTCTTCYDEIKMLKEALGISDDEYSESSTSDSEDEDEDEEEDEENEDEEVENEDGEVVHVGRSRRSHRRRRSGRRRVSVEGGDGEDRDEDIDGNTIKHSQPREITIEENESVTQGNNERNNDELNECPICSIDIKGINENEREEHINRCLTDQEFGSPTNTGVKMKRDKNRMLVYTIPESSEVNNLMINEDNECVICLDEFYPGDKVGRLECLCCFHYSCIKDWIRKKGYCECPVHALHSA